MIDRSQINTILARAYRVFVEESRLHVQVARASLSDGVESVAVQELIARFHTVRGGAGFFGLVTIAEQAKLLELRLAEPDLNWVVARQELCGLLADLEESLCALPADCDPSP